MTQDTIIADISARYRELLRKQTENYFSTPVLQLALEIGARLQDESLTQEQLDQAIRDLTLKGLEKRAQRMARYIGNCHAGQNKAFLRQMLETALLKGEKGRPVPFEVFQARISHVYYGFVFTAHPTFAMTRDLTCALNRYASTLAGSGDKDTGMNQIAEAMDKPFHTPDLNEEHDFAMRAIGHLHQALDMLHDVVLDLGRQYYPRDWVKLRPQICSVASWVAFDLDGRKDIGWTDIMGKRLKVQAEQIARYAVKLAAIRERFADEAEGLEEAQALLDHTLEDLETYQAFFESYDVAEDPGHEKLQEDARRFVQGSQERLTHPDPLISLLENKLEQTDNDELRHVLVHMIAQLESIGLGRAHIHMRINSRQLHNALRTDITLQAHPDDPRYRNVYLDKLLYQMRTGGSFNIHFGNILEEQATAPREFMLIQQIVKHIDSHSPIRFLIAETESAFTILAALHFAKKFGVEDHVDICPLFETQTALQRGTKYLETLLEIPEYRDYVTRRGKLCIQTGYSDAGRYIGQSPATGSIERLKERMVGLMARHKLEGVDLLFFDTHGESTGRGAQPESLEKRMAYIAPPHFRHMLASHNIAYTQESSFQGGDGYSFFMTDHSALAVLTRILGYWMSDCANMAPDPYYHDRNGVTQFFNDVMTFQRDLMNDRRYGTLLTSLGPNMIVDTGSRALKRQSDQASPAELSEARQLRAIPHNAVLGQLGMLVNSVNGIGTAIAQHPEFYDFMIKNSERFQVIAALVHRASELSDPLFMKAYIDTLDPQTWLMRKNICSDPQLSEQFSAIAQQLGQNDIHPDMRGIFQKIFEDFILLKKANDLFKVSTLSGPDEQQVHTQTPDDDDNKVDLACLHAIRLALIHKIYILATEVPAYAPYHDASRERLLQNIFRLNVPAAVKELKKIFPAGTHGMQDYDFGEESTYAPVDEGGYSEEHRRIFDPLLALHQKIQGISTAISHHAGFIG